MSLRGWLIVGLILLLIVGAGSAGGAIFVNTVLEIAAGELERRQRSGAVLHLVAQADPRGFWFSVTVSFTVSLVLVAASVRAAMATLRAKRASGKGWGDYIAGFAESANKTLPRGRPAGSKVGNIIAWILLVPIVLVVLIAIVALATAK